MEPTLSDIIRQRKIIRVLMKEFDLKAQQINIISIVHLKKKNSHLTTINDILEEMAAAHRDKDLMGNISLCCDRGFIKLAHKRKRSRKNWSLYHYTSGDKSILLEERYKELQYETIYPAVVNSLRGLD